MSLIISMIAATDENNTLGKNGDLLWHLPDDFKRFKALTINHPIVMGRKTFETFPKLLPQRTHIIITRQKDYKAEGCIVVNNIEDALEIAKKSEGGAEEICIIGGGEIYKLALPYANKIELTLIHHKFEGADAFFPEFDKAEWDLTGEVYHPEDDKHPYDFTYLTYLRR